MAILPGEFVMGSPAAESERRDDEIQHTVRTVRPFYLGRLEVTQYLWQQIMENNPSYLYDCPLCPVENVSWYEAIDFCIRLSIALDLEPAYTMDGTKVTWDRTANGMRLPTEAEWEYAYRAGGGGPFPTGQCPAQDQENFNGYLPYEDCAAGMWRGQTIPTGSLKHNAWLVYDMGGNVTEWCWDIYGAYSADEEVTDPEGPATGEFRVQRGGAFNAAARHSRCAARLAIRPGVRAVYRGFRLAYTDAADNTAR